MKFVLLFQIKIQAKKIILQENPTKISLKNNIVCEKSIYWIKY